MLNHAAHPGEILKEELEELSITPTELARQIDVPPGRLSKIINGKCAMTADTALRLGHWFQMNPQFWMNLQAQYELVSAQEAVGDSIETLPTRPEHRVATAQ